MTDAKLDKATIEDAVMRQDYDAIRAMLPPDFVLQVKNALLNGERITLRRTYWITDDAGNKMALMVDGLSWTVPPIDAAWEELEKGKGA